MLKRVVAIILLLAMTAQTFSQALIVLDYYTNTAAFASKCENKSRPVMHCNGKCQMMKKMKANEQKNGETPERKLNKSEVISAASFLSISVHGLSDATTFNSFLMAACAAGQLPGIFHPPASV